MNDLVPPGFVFTSNLIKQATEAEKWVQSHYRRERGARIGWKIFAVTGWLLVAMLGIALDFTIPLDRLVPVFFYQRPDGVTETAVTTDSLPADLSDTTIQAWLWQYIMAREAYSLTEYEYRGLVVSAMSSDSVRDAYKHFVDGSNKESYIATYGARGVIRVDLREIVHYVRATAEHPGEYTIHMARYLNVDGMPQQCDLWALSLEFVQNYNRGFRIRDILTFNPARIVVTHYPGATDLTPTNKGVCR